jgi:PEP-CTERM motif
MQKTSRGVKPSRISQCKDYSFGQQTAALSVGPLKNSNQKEDFMRPYLRTLPLVLVLTAVCAASASADQLVINGNFQTGTLAGWGDNPSPIPVGNKPWKILQDGSNYYAGTFCQGPECIEGNGTQEDYLFQDLTTVVGQTYTLSFDYSAVGASPDGLEVDFGSELVTNLVNTPDTIKTYTYSVLATSTVTRLQFLGEQNHTYDYLDNVSVSTVGSQSPVPEPGTIAMVGTGLLGLLGTARRKFFA